jgi:spore germination protein KA
MFKKSTQRSQESGESQGGQATKRIKPKLHSAIVENLDYIREELGPSTDIIMRRFVLGADNTPIAAVYTDGLTDKDSVNEFILRSLMIDSGDEGMKRLSEHSSPFEFIRTNALAIGEVHVLSDLDAVILAALSGDTVILIEGFRDAISGSTRGGPTRAVSEPSSQVVIRGPKDGFNESIGTNVALVRRRIKSSQLWLEKMKIGTVTQTDVAIMYLNGFTNDQLILETKRRLQNINYDSILESGYIEHFIEDQVLTPFPTLYNTERPDTVAANILEGRIAVFVDGTPFVLLAPTSFFMFFQASEDYYQRTDVASAIRLLRYFAFLISIFGPSIYIASITFHQEMIPTQLLISLATQRESVPFPAVVEATMMEVAFEILREAGVRMPRAIGQAVSIVGALVLGQAAVEAGIISSAMVIVVAITGISSFATPAFNMALSVRLIRFAIMMCAAFLGFFGIAIISIFLIAHMCGLRSFGLSYMSPLAPFVLESQKDTFIRVPFKKFLYRPKLLYPQNKRRQGDPPPQEDQANGRDST